MTQENFKGTGTKEDPWVLKTPPGTSEYTLYRDESRDPAALVCTVGSTVLLYDLRCQGTKSYLAIADEFIDRMPIDSDDAAQKGQPSA